VVKLNMKDKGFNFYRCESGQDPILFIRDTEGQAMTEYILMIFLIVLAAAQVLRAFGLCLDLALIQSARKLGGFGGTIK